MSKDPEFLIFKGLRVFIFPKGQLLANFFSGLIIFIMLNDLSQFTPVLKVEKYPIKL